MERGEGEGAWLPASGGWDSHIPSLRLSFSIYKRGGLAPSFKQLQPCYTVVP